MLPPDLFRVPHFSSGGRGGDRFNSQGLAILVWAAASLDHPLSQPFLRAVCAEAEAQAEGFTPQGYAMLLWGLVTTSSSSCSQVADEVVQLFECLSPSVCRAADSFQVPDISMLLYSYAMLGLEEQDLFRVLGRRLLSLLEDSKADPASPVDLATAAWALGAAGHHDHELLHVLGREAVRRRTDLSSNGLCMFAWAFATLGYSSPALFGAVRDELERGNPSCSLFDGQGLPNILWALAVAGELKPTTAVAVQAQVADLLGSGQAPSQAVLSQLFAAELSLKAFSHQRLLLKDSDLWIQARKAWSRGHDSVGPSSRVLSEAARLISSMGLDSRLSVTTEDGDIKVPLACLPAMMDKVCRAAALRCCAH